MCKQYNGEKKVFSTNSVGTIRCSYAKQQTSTRTLYHTQKLTQDGSGTNL